MHNNYYFSFCWNKSLIHNLGEVSSSAIRAKNLEYHNGVNYFLRDQSCFYSLHIVASDIFEKFSLRLHKHWKMIESRAANKSNTPTERVSTHCVICNLSSRKWQKTKRLFLGDYHFKEVNQPYLKKLWGSL